METPELSYSSMKTVQACETLYYYEKVAKLPPDSDYEDGDALGLGKAFHEVMEKTLHKKYVKELLMEAMDTHEVDINDYPILEAMLKKYVKLHKLSGLTVVGCELGLHIPKLYKGYIDMVMVAPDGSWWIGDLKTTGRFDDSLLPRLPKDMQLNLYTKFIDHVATQYGLDVSKFKGCRYRAITKPKLKHSSKESIEQYIERLEENVQVYDIEIPYDSMDPEGSWDLFLEVHQRATRLMNHEELPVKNYNNCISYFRPCKHFSKCHGELFSKMNKVKVHTIETFNEGELL